MSNLWLNRGPSTGRTRELFLKMPTPQYMGIIRWRLGKFTGPIQYVRQEGEVRNLITDVGLDELGTAAIATCTNFIGVGTGSTAPAFAQTALTAELGRTNRITTGNNTVASGPAFAYWSLTKVYLFLETEVVGNLTEVGFFSAGVAGIMFARQLFKDLTGTPTTVIKTINDQLQISYELRLYSPTADTTQSGLTISGVNYDITTRAQSIGSASVWGGSIAGNSGYLVLAGSTFGSPQGSAYDAAGSVLGATTGSPTGTKVSRSSAVASAYVGGNHYRDVTFKWEPTVANFATGIGAITTDLFQSKFTPAFAKDATKRLTLVARYSWARYP